MIVGGHAWLWGGGWCVVAEGMHGCRGGMCGCGGVCMVVGGCVVVGGMHGCGGHVLLWGVHVWLWGGMHGCGGACVVVRGAWLQGGMHGCGGGAWGACVVVGGMRGI